MRTIADFVATEAPAQALGLADDPALRRLVTVWPQVPLTFAAPEIPEDCPRWRAWRLLWEACDFDPVALGDAMGCAPSLALRTLERAKAQQLIYPDGTVNAKAAIVLGALVARGLQGPKSGRGAPP